MIFYLEIEEDEEYEIDFNQENEKNSNLEAKDDDKKRSRKKLTDSFIPFEQETTYYKEKRILTQNFNENSKMIILQNDNSESRKIAIIFILSLFFLSKLLTFNYSNRE